MTSLRDSLLVLTGLRSRVPLRAVVFRHAHFFRVGYFYDGGVITGGIGLVVIEEEFRMTSGADTQEVFWTPYLFVN